jgi:hypothetical protein
MWLLLQNEVCLDPVAFSYVLGYATDDIQEKEEGLKLDKLAHTGEGDFLN